MTRKEQIVKNANEYARLMLGDICEDWSGQYTDCVTDFVAGAKWADENPKDGLVSLDKVCEWLEDYAELTGLDYETIKESFKKAMDEQL